MKGATNFFIIFTELVILGAVIKAAYSLRCRSDDGPSEAELKRVIRSCMRKFGDANFAQNNQQQQQQQQNQQQHTQQNRQKSRAGNRENYGYGGYEDSDEMNDGDMQDYSQYNGGNFNNNRQQNNYNRNGGGGSYSSSSSSSSYDSYDERRHNPGRYPGTYNNRTNNYGGGGQNQNNNWPYNYNNNQRNYPNSRGYNNNNSYNNNNNNNSNNKSRNNNNNQNNFSNDSACIVHCFFEEMHMLNNNNYPDRHKVMYILTKDMRDRDLRNFYTDTIQECFQYLETQRRRDQCQFSRDLINCMTEYAKGNCDDWNEFNMVFN